MTKTNSFELAPVFPNPPTEILTYPTSMHSNPQFTLLRDSTKRNKPFYGVWVVGGGGVRKGGTVPNWRATERGLNVSEYAKKVCVEIGWPYSGNLTLLCDCISSLARMKGLDAWGGFFSLLEAVEHAKRTGVRVDRWFFTDGKYVDQLEEIDKAVQPEEPEVRTPNLAGTLIERKPN